MDEPLCDGSKVVMSSSQHRGTLPIAGSHIPVLDGIRGTAILAVLVYHLVGHYRLIYEAIGLASLAINFGQKGVDLFFVLSGLLITGILIDSQNSQNRWKNFFVRRALRIFPLYYVTIIVVYNLFPSVFHTTGISKHQAWLWVYLQNFGKCLGLCPDFGHFWSLAVEEQFYLIWPFLVWRFRTPRNVLTLCIVTIVTAFAIRLCLANSESFPASILFTRMDALAGGGVLACYLRLDDANSVELRRHCLRTTLITSLAGGPAYLILSGTGHGLLQAIKFSMFTALFTGLVGWALTLNHRHLVARTLRSGPLHWLGKYSYALYVFHPFLMTAVDHFGGKATSIRRELVYLCIVAIGSGFLARLSWVLLESPALSLKRHFPSATAPRVDNGAT